MQVKLNINKEMLLKHRFWITLGTAVFVILIGLFYLEMYVDASKQTKTLKGELDLSKSKPSGIRFQNDKSIAAIATVAQKAQEKERELWEKCYKEQHGLFLWAKEVEQKFDFLDGRFVSKIDFPVVKVKDVSHGRRTTTTV